MFRFRAFIIIGDYEGNLTKLQTIWRMSVNKFSPRLSGGTAEGLFRSKHRQSGRVPPRFLFFYCFTSEIISRFRVFISSTRFWTVSLRSRSATISSMAAISARWL